MKHTRLYQFQEEDVRRIQKLDGRALLASEVGLGKTIQSLYWAWKYLPETPPGPVVVCVPAHLKINWKREAQKHLGLRVEVLYEQRVPPDKLPPANPSQTFVINYEILTPPNWKARAAPPKDSWLAWLLAQKPRLVIADEGQYLRNRDTARTRAVRRLARVAPHALILTGTPLANKPADLWPILDILQPDLFPSEHEFLSEFTHASHGWWGWEYKGARDLDRLHRILERHVMIRRRKADVLHELPAVQHTVVGLDIDRAEYRRAESDFLGWLAARGGDAGSAERVAELARLNGLKKLAGELKVSAVSRWAADLLEETGGRLLLGTVHHAVSDALAAAFGRDALVVDGRCTAHEKQKAFDAFNSAGGPPLLIGNLQAAGTGWSCKATSDVALCELPWVPADVTQFIGRVHGVERGLPGAGAHARHLIAEGTIDEDLCDALERKSRWAATAIDGGADASDLDIRTLVLEMMKKRAGGT